MAGEVPNDGLEGPLIGLPSCSVTAAAHPHGIKLLDPLTGPNEADEPVLLVGPIGGDAPRDGTTHRGKTGRSGNCHRPHDGEP